MQEDVADEGGAKTVEPAPMNAILVMGGALSRRTRQ
jgi:hypothetical protein